MSDFIKIALQPSVVNRALKISLVVGTVLALINHSPAIFSLTLSPQNIIQIVLTYLVPYGVSTYSSVKAIMNAQDPPRGPVAGSDK
jgi:hypothetical protein